MRRSAGPFGDVFEGAVAFVAIQPVGGVEAAPVEPGSAEHQRVEPAIAVDVDERNPRAVGLDDVPLAVDASENRRMDEARLACDVGERDGTTLVRSAAVPRSDRYRNRARRGHSQARAPWPLIVLAAAAIRRWQILSWPPRCGRPAAGVDREGNAPIDCWDRTGWPGAACPRQWLAGPSSYRGARAGCTGAL